MRSSSFKLKRIFRIDNYIKLILLCVFLLLINFFLFKKISDNKYNNIKTNISVDLIGNKMEQLSINSPYIDSGIEVKKQGNVMDTNQYEYKIKNNIDNNIPGIYEVNYKVIVDEQEYNVTREVEVVDDIAPIIKVKNEEVSIYYCKRENTIDLDYIATDNYDGILTDKVKTEKFTDHIVLTVSDSSNNTTTIEVPINYIDEKKPIVKLNGTEIIYIEQNKEYEDLGATLEDGCGKTIEGEIVTESDVNTTAVGTYKVNYKYVLDEEIIAKNERIVVVYNLEQKDKIENHDQKTVYLTFDDGPGQYTSQLLDILKKYDVKATFFVTNQFKSYVPLIQREYEEGHAIGVHTLTHKWNIYRSVETYIKDFNDMNAIIEKYTGKRADIFRFPGGSSNTISKSQSKGVVSALANEMQKKGYVYFDWNVDSEDANYASSKKIYENVTKGMDNRNCAVILMHDIRKNTIEVIESIIIYGLEKGYEFKTLDVSSPTTHHHINN